MLSKSDKHLAIIPARGGSKRLPGKNLLPLRDKPLIAWSIAAALDSELFDRVIVSTDDEKIASVARACGAEVPFLRPAELATDLSAPTDAAIDVLNRLNDDFDSLTWLQPTSPLRSADDIQRAHTIFENRRADAVISVCLCEHSPLWSGTIESDGNMRPFLQNKNLNKVSQQLPPYYRVNGALYIVRTTAFREQRSFYIQGDRTFSYEMPAAVSIDIDTQFDFDLAKLMLDKLS